MQTCEEHYAVPFVNARVLDIMDEMMSSNFLAVSLRESYAHYCHVAKMVIKNEGVLPLLVDLVMVVSVVKMLSITHLDDLGLFISTEEGIFLLAQAAKASVKNDHQPAPFHTSAFYRHARSLLDKLHVHHREQGKKKFPRFALFSNEDSTNEKHQPFNHVPVYYHDASLRLQLRG